MNAKLKPTPVQIAPQSSQSADTERTEKSLGKIKSIHVGIGGYQDAQLGLSITLDSDGWGVSDFRGTWGPDIKICEHTKWTEADRRNTYADTMAYIGELLSKAKKTRVEDLRGVPVEVTTNRGVLVSWRILTEVL